ncbi:hypothetical protein VTI74DRAFT_11 [Chaetomium olivicolor]
MVVGRQVLLSLAVLSSLGVDNVLGAGRLRREDGAISSLQSVPSGASPGPSSEADVASLSSTTVAAVAPIWGESTGSILRVEGASLSREPQAISSGSAAIRAGPGVASPAGEDHTSGAFGVGGTWTTDTHVPSRTEESTGTLTASSSSGPPPAETTRPSLTRTPPTRPGTWLSSSSEPASTTTSAEAATAVQSTTAPQSRPTPPRGGPPGGGPPNLSTIQLVHGTTESVNLGYGTTTSSEAGKSSLTTFETFIRSGNQTYTYSPSITASFCQQSDLTVAPTSWSVVHTTTITWYGNPEDYTQPYPPISTPRPTTSCVVAVEPPRVTLSICASTGTESKYRTCEVTLTTESYNFGIQTTIVPPIIFLTTDKNPAVVFSTIKTPDYGVSQEPKTRDNHASPTRAGGAVATPPIYNSENPPQAISDSAHSPTPTPITVAVQPTAVVINGNTIRDNPAQQTQVVIIAGQTFTIDPIRVVGGGATIDRPSATGGIFVPTPTSTTLGGVPITLSSSIAIIGSSSFTLGPTSTTAIISSQTFTLLPTAIAISSSTLPLPILPSPTEIVVAGGDLLTAVGRSVLIIHSTTLTYSTRTTLQVDDDTITLGPDGTIIISHPEDNSNSNNNPPATTLTIPAGSTQYALVGGATLTKIGASVVVIRSVTYTVGPGMTGTTTTVVGGETVTIAPTGVVVGSVSLGYPFGATTTVITPGAGVGAGSARATSTAGMASGEGASGNGGGGGGTGEEDGGAGLRPWLDGVGWGVGVAVMVGILV